MESLKKILVLAFSFTFVFSSVFFIESKAEAQTASIQELQERILELQAILNDLISRRSTSFVRELKQGDRGEDVRRLQTILNSDSQTQIAFSGAGSPGQETEFFGTLTKGAVIRFQQKYATEILYPYGVYVGTGIVDEPTRTKLNSLSGNQVQTGGIPDTNAFSTNLQTFNIQNFQPQEGFYVREPSSYVVSPGETFYISGGGFDSSVQVAIAGLILPKENTNISLGQGDQTSVLNPNQFSGNSFGDAFSLLASGDSLSIKLPSNFPKGIHDLYLVKGSFYTNPGTKIIVKTSGVASPSISNIREEEKRIVIEGTNFTNSNMVQTSYGRIHKLPSQNGSIFVSKSRLSEALGGTLGFSDQATVSFSVINENGFSQSVEKSIGF